MDQAQSEILAQLEGTASTAHDKVKDEEAKAGGKILPGGLKDAVATISNCKLAKYQSGDAAGQPYIFIYATCVSPQEYAGINLGVELMYPLTESRFASEEENLNKLYSDLKLAGLTELIQTANSKGAAIRAIMERINDNTKPAISFKFNTGNRLKKSGTYSVFIQGSAESQSIPVGNVPQQNTQQPSGTQQTSSPSSTDNGFVPGDRVNVINNYFEDGKDYAGVVEKVQNGKCQIKFDDDGSLDFVPNMSIVKLFEPATQVESTNQTNQATQTQFAPEEGDVVSTPKDHYGDGESWEGTLTKIEGTEYTVSFSDGSEDVFALSDLSPADDTPF